MSTPIPEGSVIITPMEVYREMQATHLAVQGIAAKLDAALVDNDRRLTALDGPDGKLKDHEQRIRAIADGTAPVIVDLNKEISGLRKDQQSTSRTAWIGVGIALAASVALPIVIPVMTAKH